jgi:hypothetical protein
VASATEHESDDLVSTEIELDRLVHFSGPKGGAVTLDAGRYLVQERGEKTLAMVDENGKQYEISAVASEHDEALPNSQVLSVPLGEDSYRVLFLQTDGSSLEAAGTYSGIITRDAVNTADMDHVSAAYEDWLQSAEVNLRAVRLQPQAYDPRPKTALTWQQQMEMQRAGRITSSVLRNAIAKTFSSATVTANACGGSYVYRKTIVNIPTVPFHEEHGLQRLHHNFTGGEREKSQYKTTASYGVGNIDGRRYSLRACVDDWRVQDWQGQVANGLLEVHMSFGSSDIATRALDYYRPRGFWQKYWEWNSSRALYATKDHLLYPVMIATLKPTVVGGQVTIAVENIRWDNRRNMWSEWGDFRVVSREADVIVRYKINSLDALHSQLSRIFNNSAVRTSLSNELTQALLANSFVNRITGIDSANSGGAVVTVTYQ